MSTARAVVPKQNFLSLGLFFLDQRRVIDEDARVGRGRQGAQDLGELGGAELARSTGAAHALGEPADALPLVGHARARLYKEV